MPRKNRTTIPSVAEYKRAFLAIEPSIPKAQREMLLANYHAPSRTITTAELAKKVGYKSYSAAVLQYGRLGHRLCELLEYQPTMTMSNGDLVWTSVVADAPSKRSIDEWEWKLRPEVAQALEELGWVEGRKASDDTFGTVDDYFKAFQALQEEGIHEQHRALLKVHCDAPKHTATWAQLAKVVGYPNGDTVNMQYGTLARRVAEQLGVREKPKGFWLYVLADWAARKGLSGHTAFVLRPQVVQALEKLGWVEAASSPTSRVIVSLLADPQIQAHEVQLAAMEGRHYIAEAKFRLRNRALIEEKKRQSDGKCNVCKFDFQATYKGLERNFLVGHHVKPIGKRKKATKTTLADIDVLCPNCHAAVHSEDPPLCANELRSRITTP